MGVACGALDSNWIGTGVRVPREQRPRVSVVWAQSLMSIDCIRSFFPLWAFRRFFPPPKHELASLVAVMQPSHI